MHRGYPHDHELPFVVSRCFSCVVCLKLPSFSFHSNFYRRNIHSLSLFISKRPLAIQVLLMAKKKKSNKKPVDSLTGLAIAHHPKNTSANPQMSRHRRDIAREFENYFGNETVLANWQRLMEDLGLKDDFSSIKKCKTVRTHRPNG